jgi:hypothetical protein
MSTPTVPERPETPAHSSLARLGADLLRRADESQPALDAAWDHLMTDWNVRGEPVGVERLRLMIQTETGENPADNDFSRELIALREERRS